MRGEHGAGAQLGGHGSNLGCRLAFTLQLIERPQQAGWLRRCACRLIVLATSTNAMDLLGRVDEQEEEREGASYGCRLLGGKLVHLTEQLVESARAVCSATSITTGDPQCFDGGEHVVALEALDDATKRAGEPSHVIVEGLVFGSGFSCAHGLLFGIAELGLTRARGVGRRTGAEPHRARLGAESPALRA